MKSNPNIVQYYNHFNDKNSSKIYIIMEYCEEGNIERYLTSMKRQGKYLKESNIWEMVGQIVTSLDSIHRGMNGNSKIHMVHRNIKPSNILLSGNIVKIGDFGRIKRLG